MTKTNKLHESGYAMVDGVHTIVLPVEVAVQVFTLLCQGEKVSYDWQTKTYKRDKEYLPALKMFSVIDMASLSLNEE